MRAKTVATASFGHSPQVFVFGLLSNYNNERPDTQLGPLALTVTLAAYAAFT
jgi:hypothetical protein